MRSRTTLAMAIFALSVAFPTPIAAQEDLPVIATARARLDSGILTLQGENFGPAPVVRMGASAGTLEDLVIVSASDRLIEAKLATTAPGTYLVVVRRDPKKQPNHVASIDVTIGTIGPPGPPGAAEYAGHQLAGSQEALTSARPG